MLSAFFPLHIAYSNNFCGFFLREKDWRRTFYCCPFRWMGTLWRGLFTPLPQGWWRHCSFTSAPVFLGHDYYFPLVLGHLLCVSLFSFSLMYFFYVLLQYQYFFFHVIDIWSIFPRNSSPNLLPHCLLVDISVTHPYSYPHTLSSLTSFSFVIKISFIRSLRSVYIICISSAHH